MNACFSKIESFPRLLGNIAELRFLLHLTTFLVIVLTLTVFSSFAYSQPVPRTITDADSSGKPPLIFPLPKYPEFEISDEDIADTIATFKTDNPAKFVKRFQERLEKPITDDVLRKEISEGVYKLAGRTVIEDKKFIKQITDLFSPVLKLYNRENTYEFIVLKHPTPYIGVNTGSVIVVTTGLFFEAKSDAELMGYMAHEIGHEYFYYYSRYTKHLFDLTESRDQENALNRHIIKMLGIIELQCDGFAAITMAHLGYNPVAFLEGTQRTEQNQNFEMDARAVHPDVKIRIRFVKSIFDKDLYLNQPLTKSSELTAIQTQLRPKFHSIPIN